MDRNRGGIAAWLAFGYSLVVTLWAIAATVMSPTGGWSAALGGLPLLAIPTVITAIGALTMRAGAGTRFKIRLVVAVLMVLEVTAGFFLLGLLFIPAAVACVVSAIQARPIPTAS